MNDRKDTTPIWHAAAPACRQFPALDKDIEADVAIIGGGITGITAAALLSAYGRKVVVLELGCIGGGTTGYNSGHLSTMADTWYHKIESDLGADTAVHVATAMQDAVRFVEKTSQKYGIDCGFRWVDGYTYTEKRKDIDLLFKEEVAARKAGLTVGITEEMPLPVKAAAILRFEKQAQFDPLAYVRGLAEAIQGPNCSIYENTIVRRIEEDEPTLLETDHGTVRADKVILATHMPISLHPLQTEVFPYMSYCIAVKAENASGIQGLFTDTFDPYHYIRDIDTPEGPLLIVGGADHKTGHITDTASNYRVLEEYARKLLGPIEVRYRWSGQYYKPADGIPFIGYSAFSRHTLVGTGYSGDGLTWGTAAARILTDIILDRENPLSDTFSATRFNLMASAKGIFKENADAVRNLIADRFSGADAHSLREVLPGQGKIILLDGKKLAVYRDENGKYFAMSPLCHHMGCYVHWNNAETTWDCPCHGSRFSAHGKVIYGPVLHDLDSKEIEVEE